MQYFEGYKNNCCIRSEYGKLVCGEIDRYVLEQVYISLKQMLLLHVVALLFFSLFKFKNFGLTSFSAI